LIWWCNRLLALFMDRISRFDRRFVANRLCALRIKMSQKPQIFLLSVGLMTMSACDDPFVFAAGGELTGRVEATPQRWQFDEKSALAQLETRPEAPLNRPEFSGDSLVPIKLL